MPTPVKAALVRVAREPLRLRTLRELVYAVLSLPLGIVGFIYVAVSFAVGGGLAITFIGLPLLGFAATKVRYLSLGQRELARSLVGGQMPSPPPRRTSRGFFGWLRSSLLDPVAWRAYLYCAIKAPISIAMFSVAVLVWVYGLGAMTYPAWRPFLPKVSDSFGTGHRAAALGNDIFIDTWPRVLAACLAGVVVTLAAPWVVRGVLAIDRGAMWALLSGDSLFQRVRELEASRAYAIDDSAAQLRRIERDLHDGAQARLVAVAMSLGEAKELLAQDTYASTDAERTRQLARALFITDGAVEKHVASIFTKLDLPPSQEDHRRVLPVCATSGRDRAAVKPIC